MKVQWSPITIIHCMVELGNLGDRGSSRVRFWDRVRVRGGVRVRNRGRRKVMVELFLDLVSYFKIEITSYS